MLLFFPMSQGEEDLTTYTFNTHAAKHTFCKICGVQSFYTPRSNPNGYGKCASMPHHHYTFYFGRCFWPALLTVNTGWLGCAFYPGLTFRYVLLPLGIAPHCLDPGTVCSVTVEDFCGEKWEESMQAHKTIRGMSSPVEETL